MSRIPRYNLRSRSHARASSLSTLASEKIPKVSDTFGDVVLNPLFSKNTPAEGPNPMGELPNSVESPLTSEGRSTRTENRRQSALESPRSYSEVVRACSPAIDIKVEQESNIALDAITSVEVHNDINETMEGAGDCATFRTAQESSKSSSESDDGDDRPWITVG